MDAQEFVEGLKSLIGMPAQEPKLLQNIEVAKTGTFKSMAGHVVNLTKEKIAALSASFDANEYRPKVALGHGPHESHVPAAGEVTALRVSERGGRLLADVMATPNLVSKINSGEYRERSIEFQDGENPKFLGLAFLGARQPAIKGLAPIPAVLAEATVAGAEIVLAQAGEELTEEEVKGSTVTPTGTPTLAATAQVVDSDRTIITGDKTMSDDSTVKLAEAEAKIKAFEAGAAKVRKSYAEDAKRFLESGPISKKLPMQTRKAGVEVLLTKLAEIDFDAPVMLADGDGKEVSMYELAKRVIESYPEQLAENEQKEIAKGGTTEDADISKLAAVLPGMTTDPEGDVYTALAEQEIANEAAKGKTIDFAEGARRVYAKRGDRG